LTWEGNEYFKGFKGICVMGRDVGLCVRATVSAPLFVAKYDLFGFFVWGDFNDIVARMVFRQYED